MKEKEIIVGVTGCIAAYKTCEVVRLLKKKNVNITVVMTKEATEFVTPLTFQTLSANPVIIDMFKVPEQWDPTHISLADRANLVVVVPATANIMARFATGTCDDILSCLLIATRAPIIICPAMNEKMYLHPAVQGNLEILKKRGVRIIPPVRGKLACGYEGIGHLAPVEEIIKEIEKIILINPKSETLNSK
jgi:phosphopantothenoylcysteine synthetase/decarboxylase